MRLKAGLLVAVGMLLAPLAFASSASAQGAVLTITPNVVSPGQAVTVSGSGFAIGFGGDLRLNFRDAEPLRPFAADSRGRFSESVPIPPSTAPGTYLMIGTQVTEFGRQRAFTPGRAKLRVVAASSAAAGAAPGGGPPAAIVGGLIGLAAIAAGTALYTRRRHATQSPAPQPLGTASSR